MAFIDLATVKVIAGPGGAGACSFARFKYVPKGGPDGGDGGRGGSVYVQADANLATLLDYKYQTICKAQRGLHGKGKNMTGRSGNDLYCPCRAGPLFATSPRAMSWVRRCRSDQPILVAKGGRGGRGNARFATSTHQAPREWEPGGEGQERDLELELKLIADVGLVGEPNAGKSTLLSVVSAARPKIADYPFTTLEPNLGVVGLSGARSYVMADIPGIIEGAHLGKGLGLQFLRHVERTRLLAFLIPLDAEDPQQVVRPAPHRGGALQRAARRAAAPRGAHQARPAPGRRDGAADRCARGDRRARDLERGQHRARRPQGTPVAAGPLRTQGRGGNR